MNLDIKAIISTIVLIIGVSIIATILLPVTTKPAGQFIATSTTVVSSTVTTVVSSTLTTLVCQTAGTPYQEGLFCEGNRLVGKHCLMLPGGIKQCTVDAPIECKWPSPKCCVLGESSTKICGAQVTTSVAFCKPIFLPNSICLN